MSESITIVGTITEPEQRHAAFGAVTTFRLGTSNRKRDPQSGVWSDGPTSWYRVSVYRALGEHAFASLKKGERVIVTGRLRLSTWENESGRGMAADIDADAVGHDLLWGTSLYTRASVSSNGGSNGGGNGDPAATEAQPSTALTAQEASVWSAPLTESFNAQPATSPASASPLASDEWASGQELEEAQATPF